MPDPQQILVVAPNWLGDAVMALPAIADIRRALPTARVIVGARRSVAELFTLAPPVDEVVTLGWDGRWRARGSFAGDVVLLRELGADVAILLPNSFAAAWLVRRAGVPERWGYATDLRRLLLTRAVARPRGSRHQGAYYQHLTRALGVESGPLEPVVAVPERALAAACALLRDRGWDGASPLVVCAPGAAYGTAKQWIPSSVVQLVTDLVRMRQATCVFVGTAADAPTARSIASGLDREAAAHLIDVTGDTTLEGLAAVLALARACVSNDSGAMHVAAAVGTPLVALFGPTRERETAPLTRAGGHADVLTHPVWCRPCMLRTCPIDHRCMTGITPQRVLARVDRLIAVQ